MDATEFVIEPSYGKQSVPVFKVLKEASGRHSVLDMVVQIELHGDVALSWTRGDNRQIVPTETQKNTCYAIALQNDFTSPEEYAIILGKDMLDRHRHLSRTTINVSSRRWERVFVDKIAHNHAFTSSPSPVKSITRVIVDHENAPLVRSGVVDLRLMKTTNSGFAGFIKDKYTDLQPVGSGSANPDRIMCTEMTAVWDYNPRVHVADYNATNSLIIEKLTSKFAGPAPDGVFSKSLQETVYNMSTTVLTDVPEISEIDVTTPNVHFYSWDAARFGLSNPNVVFQSTEPSTTASGRIRTRMTRKSQSKL